MPDEANPATTPPPFLRCKSCDIVMGPRERCHCGGGLDGADPEAGAASARLCRFLVARDGLRRGFEIAVEHAAVSMGYEGSYGAVDFDDARKQLEREISKLREASEAPGPLTAAEAADLRRCIDVAWGEGLIEEDKMRELEAAVDRVTA